MSSNDKQPPGPDPRRVLVVRLGAMGDVIHALPAVSALANSYPGAAIDWIVEPHWAPLLHDHPRLNSVIPFPLKAWRRDPLRPSSWSSCRSLFAKLRSQEYDLVVDLQGLIKSAVLARLSGCPRRAGFEAQDLREPLAGRFYTQQLAAPGRHVVDKNLAAVASLTGAQVAEPEFPLPHGELSPQLPEGDFVLTTPAAGWGSKQWPRAHYSQLGALLQQAGVPLVLDCAPNDRTYVEEIARAAPAGSIVIHPSSIAQLIGATRRARAVVGVDSGPLHLAAALGKPGVAVYGPTDPSRNGPYGESFRVLRDQAASTSYQRDLEVAGSMKSVAPNQVFETLRPLLP